MHFVRIAMQIALFSLSATGLAAQSRAGGGISVGASGHASIAYIREEWGSPDSVRLAAAVLWRGPGTRGFMTSPAEEAASRASTDSAQAESLRHHRWAGGSITPRGEAWVEYDPNERAVYVRPQRIALPAGDSLLVVLVDGTVPVTDALHIQTRTLPGIVDADLVRAALASGSGFAEASMARDERWSAALSADPVTLSFLTSSSARRAP